MRGAFQCGLFGGVLIGLAGLSLASPLAGVMPWYLQLAKTSHIVLAALVGALLALAGFVARRSAWQIMVLAGLGYVTYGLLGLSGGVLALMGVAIPATDQMQHVAIGLVVLLVGQRFAYGGGRGQAAAMSGAAKHAASGPRAAVPGEPDKINAEPEVADRRSLTSEAATRPGQPKEMAHSSPPKAGQEAATPRVPDIAPEPATEAAARESLRPSAARLPIAHPTAATVPLPVASTGHMPARPHGPPLRPTQIPPRPAAMPASQMPAAQLRAAQIGGGASRPLGAQPRVVAPAPVPQATGGPRPSPQMAARPMGPQGAGTANARLAASPPPVPRAPAEPGNDKPE